MKFKFIKIKRHDFDFEPYWVVCVDNTERLLHYLKIIAERNVQNYWLAKETIKKQPGNPHFGSQGGLDKLQHVMVMELEKHEDRQSMIDDLNIISEVFATPYVKCYQSRGELHCNPVGGFAPACAYEFDILDTVESDYFEFPVDSVEEVKKSWELKPRIIQWPNGTHFYAKVGVEDVRDAEGRMKWDTYPEAEAAIEYYLKTKVR